MKRFDEIGTLFTIRSLFLVYLRCKELFLIWYYYVVDGGIGFERRGEKGIVTWRIWWCNMAFREEERGLQLRREMGLEAHISKRGSDVVWREARGEPGRGKFARLRDGDGGDSTGRMYYAKRDRFDALCVCQWTYVYLSRLGRGEGCHHPPAERCGKLIEQPIGPRHPGMAQPGM